MRAFVIGAIFGIAIGGTGMWLFLERPWVGDAVVAAADAGVDAKQKVTKKKRRKRRRRGRDGQHDRVVNEVVELSAADRAPMWKGPGISLPARNVDFGEGGGGRPLNQNEINQGMGGMTGGISGCIGRARGNAELKATIKLKMLVDANGRVSRARVRAPSYLHNNGLYGCVKGVLSSARFAATGAPTVVTFPFSLSY